MLVGKQEASLKSHVELQPCPSRIVRCPSVSRRES